VEFEAKESNRVGAICGYVSKSQREVILDIRVVDAHFGRKAQ